MLRLNIKFRIDIGWNVGLMYLNCKVIAMWDMQHFYGDLYRLQFDQQ